jgi:hypothetical protein
VPLIKEAISVIDSTQCAVTLLDSTARGHSYLYAELVVETEKVPGPKYRPRDLQKVLESAITFPIVWTSSLGSGWSTIEGEGLTTKSLEEREKHKVSIFGTGKWPRADVVTVKCQLPYFDPIDIPDPLVIHSFEAKTRAGHALTGTVLHQLIVSPKGIYFCALGSSSKGAPIIGGVVNNSVACSHLWGSWPTLVRNMRQNLQSQAFLALLAENVKDGTFTQQDLLRNTKLLYEEMPTAEWFRQTGTQGLVMFGDPLRRLSWSYYAFADLFEASWPKDKEKF